MESLFKEVCEHVSINPEKEEDKDECSLYGENKDIAASYQKVKYNLDIGLEIVSFKKTSKMLITTYLLLIYPECPDGYQSFFLICPF